MGKTVVILMSVPVTMVAVLTAVATQLGHSYVPATLDTD
jgi:hypothetical protein